MRFVFWTSQNVQCSPGPARAEVMGAGSGMVGMVLGWPHVLSVLESERCGSLWFLLCILIMLTLEVHMILKMLNFIYESFQMGTSKSEINTIFSQIHFAAE